MLWLFMALIYSVLLDEIPNSNFNWKWDIILMAVRNTKFLPNGNDKGKF